MNEEKKILELVGGEGNIVSVSHCITRLRFVLKDKEKANEEEIKKLHIVKGTFTQAGQFQVIIGNNVTEVFDELVKDTNLNTTNKEDLKEVAKSNQNCLQQFSSFLAEIFVPILPAIIVGGLILGFRSLLEIPLEFLGGNPLTDIQFWSGVHDYLWLIGDAIFTYLPVHVAWSSYKRMGGTPVLGIVLGITLVAPDLLTNAYDFAAGTDPNIWNFGFISFNAIGYEAQVIPAMLVGLLGGWLEVRLNKILPNSIRLIFSPLIVLLGVSLLSTIIIGPFGWWLGKMIAVIVNWLLNTLGFVGGAIFGFFYAPLVITGLHNTTIAIDLQLIAESGSTPLWPLIALSNIAQGSAVFAMIFVRRNADEKEISIPATISAYLGVTEPAMFGINLKYFFPFIAGMIGSAVAGAYATFTEVRALSIGIGGLPGILSIRPEDYFNFFIAMCLAIVIPMIITFGMAKKNDVIEKKVKIESK